MTKYAEFKFNKKKIPNFCFLDFVTEHLFVYRGTQFVKRYSNGIV